MESLRKILSAKAAVLLPVSVLFLVLLILGGAFVVTYEPSPYTSELAFVENSNEEGVEGSVVPASCESNPLTNHFGGDCQCNISATPCSGPSCIRTISWSTNYNIGYGAPRLYRGATGGSLVGTVGVSGSIANTPIAVGGERFRLVRPDGTVLCQANVSGPAAPSVSFNPPTSMITLGDSVSLSWNVTNATACSGSGALGWNGSKPFPSGSQSVTPSFDTTYSLTCSSPGGANTKNAIVNIAPPVITNFEVVPPVVDAFQPVNINWTVVGATNCTASLGWSGGKNVSGGTESTVPPGNTSYKLECTGPGGATQDTVNVVVNPPSVTLTATPALIGPSTASVLEWTVSGANTCTATPAPGGWGGLINPPNPNGTDSQSVTPSITTSYEMECTGPGGVTQKTAIVTMPSGSITATPCTILFNQSSCDSTVTWNSANFLGARSVKQDGIGFSTAVSGSVVKAVNPENNVFRLDDTGSLFYAEAPASIACQAGSVWVSSINTCIEVPLLVVTAEDLIRSGTDDDIRIDVTSNYDVECTMMDGVTNPPFVLSAPPALRGTDLTTRPLTSSQIVTVECHHVLYPEVSTTKSIRIEVIPSLQEI